MDHGVERLKELGETHQSEYPQVRPQLLAMVQFQPLQAAPAAQPQINHGLRGYSFLSRDSKEIVQFRLDGFTFNRTVAENNVQLVQVAEEQRDPSEF